MSNLLAPYIRRFVLVRDVDVTNISGTGMVACGAEFADAQCVVKWLTHVNSLAVYPNIDAVVAIHGHNGQTRLEWRDDEHVTPMLES